MAIRNLRYDNDPLLKRKSRPVEKIDDDIKQLIQDMFETMYKYDGLGLSAVQVGVLKRVIVVDTGEEGEKVALINPEITEYGKYIDCTEGCLSFPDIYGTVQRAESIRVKALNEKGEKIEFKAKGVFAQAIAHEIDHLDGILFIDRTEKDTLVKEINGKFYRFPDEQMDEIMSK